MNLQATTYDVFDDNGALLKHHFPDPNALPDLVKTAEATRREDHQDADFAVILVDGQDRERRYLTASPGHTALSVMYFGETHRSLPEEAEKVAAARLAVACRAHGLGVPETLTELAEGVTDLSPYVFFDEEAQFTKLAAAPSEASYALGERYPLGSAQEITAAVRYLQDNHVRLSPEDRHEFAYNVSLAASDAGLALPEDLEKMAGTDLNPEWKSHLEVRRYILRERNAPREYGEALEKIASAAAEVTPLELAQGLAHFDRRSGLSESWGKEVFDPYESCLTKKAEADVKRIDQSGPSKEYAIGISDSDILDAAGRRALMVAIGDMFGGSFAEKFAQDPVKTYQGASPRIKLLLGRMVTDGAWKR